MLTNYALRAKVLILIGALLSCVGVGEVTAQERERDRRRAQPQQRGRAQPQQGRAQPRQRGRAQPRQRGRAQPRQRGRAQSRQRGRAPQGRQRGQARSQRQVQQPAEESEPFIHGITAGAGLAIYQGDFSRNPNHNPIRYIAGSGKLSVQVGADHRLGRFDQYGLGADLVYNRLSGRTSGGRGFSAHSAALDFYGDYELPYVSQGLFRVFLGGGPNFIISPEYDNFPSEGERRASDFKEKGTRVIGSFKVGVSILDKFRIGTRVASTDLLDGYKGFRGGGGIPDFVSFLSFNYRFGLK